MQRTHTHILIYYYQHNTTQSRKWPKASNEVKNKHRYLKHETVTFLKDVRKNIIIKITIVIIYDNKYCGIVSVAAVVDLLVMIGELLAMMVVKMKIVPVTYGKMDAQHVCAIRTEMPLGAMELKVLTMITTLRNMERTHLVIAEKKTGNAIQSLFNIILVVIWQTQVGNVIEKLVVNMMALRSHMGTFVVSVAVVVGIGVNQLINLSPSSVLLLCLHLHHQHRSCFPFSYSCHSFYNYLNLI